MKFKIKDKEFIVRWKHYPPYSPKNKMDATLPKKFPNGATEAYLYQINPSGEKELVYMVAASCHVNDQFSREKGRKESLTKLLNFRRNALVDRVRFVVTNPVTGKSLFLYHNLESKELADDGFFNRKDRTVIWNEYFLSKSSSEGDVEAQFHKLLNKIRPDLEKLVVLATQMKGDSYNFSDYETDLNDESR